MPIFKINNKTVLFIHIPKTAGTSVEKLLSDYGQMSFYQTAIPGGLKTTPQHLSKHDIDLLLGDLVSYDETFTIVRNPVDRLSSEYYFRTKSILRTFNKRPDFSTWAINQFRIFKKNKFHLDSHLRPMNHFIDDSVKIFKYETQLEKLHDWISNVFQIENLRELPLLNTSEKQPQKISNECKDLIKEIYQTDFNMFDYSLDL